MDERRAPAVPDLGVSDSPAICCRGTNWPSSPRKSVRISPARSPWSGNGPVRFLRGGDRVGGGTLSRFYGWHVAILPAITVSDSPFRSSPARADNKGMSVPPACGERGSAPPPADEVLPAIRAPRSLRLDLRPGRACRAGRAGPLGARREGRPVRTRLPRNIRPEWYFVFMFQTLKLVPGGEILGLEYEAIPILLFGLARPGSAALFPSSTAAPPERGSQPDLHRSWASWPSPTSSAMTAWGYQFAAARLRRSRDGGGPRRSPSSSPPARRSRRGRGR